LRIAEKKTFQVFKIMTEFINNKIMHCTFLKARILERNEKKIKKERCLSLRSFEVFQIPDKQLSLASARWEELRPESKAEAKVCRIRGVQTRLT